LVYGSFGLFLFRTLLTTFEYGRNVLTTIRRIPYINQLIFNIIDAILGAVGFLIPYFAFFLYQAIPLSEYKLLKTPLLGGAMFTLVIAYPCDALLLRLFIGFCTIMWYREKGIATRGTRAGAIEQ